MHETTRAADDYDEIRKHLARIVEEEQPRCPVAPTKLLKSCLRESAPCPPNCRYQHDWTGPTEDMSCG